MVKAGRTVFKKRDTLAVIAYTYLLNKNVSSYYNDWRFNPLQSPPALPLKSHDFFKNYLAPIIYKTNAVNIAKILIAFGNDVYKPIVAYFVDGGLLSKHIFSAHEMGTYYSALMHGGFASSGSLKKAVTMVYEKSDLSGSNVANPNESELDQLRTFAGQGDNLTALGWNTDDISTWTGITWTDEPENRVQSIDLGYLNLTGTLDLNEFSGLISLNCAGNLLTDINFSGCTSLVDINVSHNSLTQVSLADCTALETLDCAWNQITTLGIANCAALKYLYCEQNSLASIDVSDNTVLIEFYCNNNSLTQINVTANNALNTLGCDNNYLDIQDGTAMMTDIQNIMARDGAWVSYSPQKVPEAATFNAGDISKLIAFYNTDANADKLGWDLETPKDWYFVEWVQSGSEYRVKELNIIGLELTGTLDLSGMAELTSLSCNENDLTSLNLSGCTALQYLTCNDSQLQSLDLTNCTAITNLSCENNYLDVSVGTALRTCINSLAADGSEFVVYEPQMILAEVSAFNAIEYNALSAFAQTDDNLNILGWDIDKPGEWQGVKWAFVNGEYRATEIDFSGMAVTGDLDVSNFNLLTAIDCAGSSISSVSLPATLTAIGDSAFSGCANLTSIVIPNGVQTIGEKAFLGCGSLANVTIGDDVNTIGFGAFAGCNSLANIAVSANNLDFSVVNGVLFNFAGTSLIYYPAGSPATEYSIPNNVTSIEKGAFFGCPNLESVLIGTGITAISSESFSQCTKLKNVDFPDSLTSIETGAFSYCPALTSIYLPAGLIEIKDNAFWGCSNLEKAIVENNTASIGSEAFSYYYDTYLPLTNLTIYCYEGSSVQAYAIANGLNYYTYKISVSSGSNALINKKNNFIYGLTPGLTSLDGYVDLASGYSIEYIQTPNGFGTGTVVNVNANTKADTVIESYTIVVFGDVNGDGSVDSLDAGNMVDYENYMVNWDPLTNAAIIKAADLNDDGSIDSLDAGIAVDAENYMADIDQNTGGITYKSKITFNSAGGNVIEPITGYAGDPVVSPEAPVKGGYTFAGWSPSLPATFPNTSLTVTAMWTPKPVIAITFDSAGGSAIETLTGCAGDPVVAPANPVKEGYTFAGWSPSLPATFPNTSLAVMAMWIVPVSSIEVTKLPDKTEYSIYFEEELDLSGLEITVYYTNGTSAVWIFDGFDNLSFNGHPIEVDTDDMVGIGTSTITVYYLGAQTTFNIEVVMYPTGLVLELDTEYIITGTAPLYNQIGTNAYFFSFTPVESGYYSFYSGGDIDTNAILLNEFDPLPLAEDEDSGEGSNFSLSYNLTAGVKYTFVIICEEDSILQHGSYSVFLEKTVVG